MSCVFCEIVAGTIPSHHVFEDEVSYAFLDIDPMYDGHTVVVPKKHVVDALSDEITLAEISPAVVKVGRMLRQKLGADGVNIVTNVGETSGQSVFHLHVHVIPRYADAPGFANLVSQAPQHSVAEVAEKLAS